MQTATYKGRNYRVLYIGETKFGRRARLQFMDGSKDFWVDASLVSASNGGSSAPRRSAGGGETKRCWECGCSFTYADAKRGGGDWSDSYCGC